MNRSALLIVAAIVAAVAVIALRPQVGRWQAMVVVWEGKQQIIAVDTATGVTYWRGDGQFDWGPVPSPAAK
jgi:hypothetical protein